MNSDYQEYRLISRKAAIRAAKNGIATHELAISKGISSALVKGKPKSALLVRRLDDPHLSYYLVPWESNKGVGLIARVDAATAEFLGVATFMSPTPFPFITAENALDLVIQKFNRKIKSKPILVWKPCRESTSPQRPFYQIPYSDSYVYVDMNGIIYSELTPLGLGG